MVKEDRGTEVKNEEMVEERVDPGRGGKWSSRHDVNWRMATNFSSARKLVLSLEKGKHPALYRFNLLCRELYFTLYVTVTTFVP